MPENTPVEPTRVGSPRAQLPWTGQSSAPIAVALPHLAPDPRHKRQPIDGAVASTQFQHSLGSRLGAGISVNLLGNLYPLILFYLPLATTRSRIACKRRVLSSGPAGLIVDS